MERIISIFGFIAKRRSFASLFTFFSILYLSLFVGLLLIAREEFADITTGETIFAGLFTSLGGGMIGALIFKLVSWRTQRSLDNEQNMNQFRSVVDFLWLAARCIAFIWAVSAVLILILFAVGSEAEGYSWGERILIAVKYAAYLGGIFGGLLAVYLWWQNLKITRQNKKKLARKEKTNS